MNRKTPIQPKTIKMFLNCLNSWTSNFIIEQFRTDHLPEAKTKYEFIGLLDQSGNSLPKYLSPEIIEINYNYSFQESLFNADILIYNLNEGDYKEIEYILTGLTKLKHESEKTLIIISSIMTWANTPPKDSILRKETKTEPNTQSNNEVGLKTIKEKQVQEDADNEDLTDNKAEQNKLNEEVKEDDAALYYSDDDYLLRKPHKAYLQYNLIENRALELKNSNIKAYIICPGLLYGKGEQIFFDYFRMSWLNEPIQLITQGNNTLPTLYIEDLVTLIKRVIDKKPSQRYIIGIDQTKDNTLKGIMTAISKTIGNGQIIQLDSYDYNTIEIPHFDEMSINLKLKPSQLFFDERRENEDIEDYEKRSFKWGCQYGIAENIDKIQADFILYKQLTSLKVIILGMPYSGKTFIGKHLSNMFKLPLLNIGDIIKWGKEQLNEELSKEVNSKCEELASKLTAEEEQYNKRSNKKKTDPPFDAHQASKLPIDLVVRLIHSYIQHKGQCFTHGYIIDGFPRTLNEAQALHFNSETKELLDDTLPHNVIILENCTEEYVSNRVKESDAFKNDPNSIAIQERMTRRLLRYKDTHDKEIAPNTIEQLYRDNNVEILKIDITKLINDNKYNKRELLTLCKDFLLKNGEYMKNCEHLGYSIPEIQDEEERMKEGDGEENKKEDAEGGTDAIKKANTDNILIKKKKKKVVKQETIHSNIFDDDNLLDEFENQSITKPRDKLEEQKEKDQQLLEKKSEVLRRYLAENVIPILSKGILQISKTMPEDPVDSLANFLLETTFEKSINKGNAQEAIKKNENLQEEAEDNEHQVFIHQANQL